MLLVDKFAFSMRWICSLTFRDGRRKSSGMIRNDREHVRHWSGLGKYLSLKTTVTV